VRKRSSAWTNEKICKSRLNVLKIKLEAAEAIHAVLIGMIIRLLPVNSDKFLEQVRKSIRVRASAPTSTAAEGAKILAKQYAQEALDKIETAMNNLGQQS